MNNKIWLTPLKLYLLWLLLYILFLGIGIPIYDNGHSGGEQRPLTLIAYSIYYFTYGVILISFVIIPIFFWKWFKEYWLLSTIIGLIFLALLIAGINNP